MGRTGIATVPLHYGKTPYWLFDRMRSLSKEIIIAIVSESGAGEFLKRLADPFWFQALGCILGFDWHSSGLTTTVCGALKEGIKDVSKNLGVFIAGGKGATSRRTPIEIESVGKYVSVNTEKLIYSSKMSAKVDNTALQDGYQLYHHTFIFTRDGQWAVIQQGMNESDRTARRYHWLSDDVNEFVCEPHSAICSEKDAEVLNMVAKESTETRNVCANISRENPERTLKEIKKLQELKLPQRHEIKIADISPDRIKKTLLKAYERQPENFESLLGIEGVGPKTIRALALLSELLYEAPPSFRDPARFSFAHGGKDGHPYPVDRKAYDTTIDVIRKAIASARIGNYEKMQAIKRMSEYFGQKIF